MPYTHNPHRYRAKSADFKTVIQAPNPGAVRGKIDSKIKTKQQGYRPHTARHSNSVLESIFDAFLATLQAENDVVVITPNDDACEEMELSLVLARDSAIRLQKLFLRSLQQ